MKAVEFRGSALNDLRSFPQPAMREAGYQLDRVQNGLPPNDAKAMPTIGAGVVELRIWDEAGAFRVVYVAKLADAVYVLHCFQKKTQQTAKRDIELAQKAIQGLDERGCTMTTKQRFAGVWDAIEDTPQEAASMRARAALMMSLTEVIREQGMTQAEAATLLGVTQPRVSDLMRGKVTLFSLDTLIDMAATAGMTPTVKVSAPKAPPVKRAPRRPLAHA